MRPTIIHFLRSKRTGALFLTLFLLLPHTALSDETYRFERLWPTLRQPWYFAVPFGISVDKKGFLYVADSGNNRIRKFTSDGMFVKSLGSQDLFQPRSMAVGGDGNVYVTDYVFHRIQKINSSGDIVAEWGGQGSADGLFNSPWGIAVDDKGDVYVADSNNHRVQKFAANGTFILKWGTAGSEKGQLAYPRGIAVDAEGRVCVADSGNARIQRFSGAGEFIDHVGQRGAGEGEFDFPVGISVSGDGNIYVSDGKSDRILKFNSKGSFLTQWGGPGVGDSLFDYPSGIVADHHGNVYVADAWNHRVQKFAPDGAFITSWTAWGDGDGHFNLPTQVALDTKGNVYVADSENQRIQKFDSAGRFICKWQASGGIATDASDHVYVANPGLHQIEKYSSDGVFLSRWGSRGTGDGQFFEPSGIEVDFEGNIYVADSGNNRVQKFASDGTFLTKWGSKGSGDGRFDDPFSIAADREGNVYVVDYSGTQKFTSEGQFVRSWFAKGRIAADGRGHLFVADYFSSFIRKYNQDGELLDILGEPGSSPFQFSVPGDIAIGGDGALVVSDTQNHRIQVFHPITAMAGKTKAIVVAGGGPFPGNNLWDATQMCANFAYRALTYQGFTKEYIQYLSANIELDLDNNGVADDVDADAANADLQTAITTWAKDADSLVLYLADHGGEGIFRMSGAETLSVSDLDTWLDSLQETLPGEVVVVYDACESGSFLSHLTPPSGKKRIVVTSTSPDESAKFVTQGAISFSSYFWTHIFNGINVGEAFGLARDAISTSFDDQTPLLDANGNGVGNEAEDTSLSINTYIGNGAVIEGDAPEIGSVSPAQTITGKSSADLYAQSVTDSDGIARVWGVIRTPDFTLESSGNPVTSLPSIDLMPVGADRYEGSYTGFNRTGTYQVAIYARDRAGNTSIPKLTTVSVNNPLSRKAVIVAGGPPSGTLWPAIQNNAGAACEALTFQGYTDDDIYFMSPVTFMTGVDGLPTLSNIRIGVPTWIGTDTQDLVVYLIGNGGNKTFALNETETLDPTALSEWLDLLQTSISGNITLIYDACRSGSFMPFLTPPAGKKRIVICGSSEAESAFFLSEGHISFSTFFWNQVANGADVRNAFLHGKDAIAYACRGQTPQMDDNGNGIGNEKSDGILARSYTIGSGIILAGDDPIIGSVCPALSLSGDTKTTLWAADVTTTGAISRVWAAITPPGYAGNPDTPVTDMPALSLTHTGGNRYEGTYNGFSSEGTYEVAFHAMDSDGNLSFPIRTTVTVGCPTCPQCTTDPVILKDITFDPTTNCVCIAMTAITIGSGVKIESGATVTFKAPKVTLQSGLHVEKGAVVKIVQE